MKEKKGKKVRFWMNSCQKLFFRITNHGKECPDPRSGLRGFPASLKELALCTEGKSYDYELNFLDAAIQKTPMRLYLFVQAQIIGIKRVIFAWLLICLECI